MVGTPRRRCILFTATVALCLIGCATAQLDDGDRLYTGGSVHVSEKDEPIADRRSLERSLESQLAPRPNTSILGLRPRLWIYGLTERGEEGGVRRWVRERFGEAPVLFDESVPAQAVPAIEDTLFNRGFFDADVSYELDQSRRTVSVRYDVLTRPAWRVRSVRYPEEPTDPLTAAVIESVSGSGSLLETGVPYDLDRLISERERIDRFVRERGFFLFNTSHIVFDAELDALDRSVSLSVVVEAPDVARIAYEVGSIAIYADYAPDRELPAEASADPAENIEYFESHPRFEPEHIVGALSFRPGDVHDRRTHTASLSRLNSMETFQFVNIRYQPNPETGLLHAEVLLTPRAQRNVQGEVSAVQRFGGFAGPAAGIRYTDRNLSGGGERLNVGLGASLETRITGGSFRLEGYEVELGGAIRFPRSVGPLSGLGLIDTYGGGTRLPRTSMRLAMRRRERFRGERIDEASSGLSYEWPGTISHEWRLIDLTVIRRRDADTDAAYQLLLESSWLSETAGTIAATDLRYRLGGEATVGTEALESTTFLKIDTDSRLFVPLLAGTLLASRVRAGAGVAGGAGATLPEPRRFVAGGSSGLRGFVPGSFGPGTIAPGGAEDASGEIRLVSSLEYRFGIVGWLKGALFADAGNTWMMSGPERLQSLGQIFSESAVNVGAGIRIDPEILVVRLDAGVPVRRPWREPGDRWVIPSWDIGSREWRRENLIINLAIGYPF